MSHYVKFILKKCIINGFFSKKKIFSSPVQSFWQLEQVELLLCYLMKRP